VMDLQLELYVTVFCKFYTIYHISSIVCCAFSHHILLTLNIANNGLLVA